MPVELKSAGRCPRCGLTDPSPWRIDPCGVEHLGAPRPNILWRCPGATRPDPGFLRIGILEAVPGSCGELRRIGSRDTGCELFARALRAEVERMGAGV